MLAAIRSGKASVENEQDILLPLELGEGDRLSVDVLQNEIRRGFANMYTHCMLLVAWLLLFWARYRLGQALQVRFCFVDLNVPYDRSSMKEGIAGGRGSDHPVLGQGDRFHGRICSLLGQQFRLDKVRDVVAEMNVHLFHAGDRNPVAVHVSAGLLIQGAFALGLAGFEHRIGQTTGTDAVAWVEGMAFDARGDTYLFRPLVHSQDVAAGVDEHHGFGVLSPHGVKGFQNGLINGFHFFLLLMLVGWSALYRCNLRRIEHARARGFSGCRQIELQGKGHYDCMKTIDSHIGRNFTAQSRCQPEGQDE